jgi:beta-lactamase regulating signal transducer with metallopeptidase domain
VDAVLNWIWQGTVVALAAAGMLRLLEPARAGLRYRALWIALIAILLLPLASFLPIAAFVPAIASAAVPAAPVIPLPSGWWLSSAVLIGAAAAWGFISSARVLAAAVALRRARRDCRPLDVDVESRLARWSELRTMGRQTRLVVSDAVTSAAVLAGRSPVIALAPSVIDQLSVHELDRVVVHEWSHVQRRDDLMHLLQVAVRLFAGWHPAVWWCDRRLHLEREIACDEMTVSLTGSTRAYAACLAKLASLPSLARPPLQAIGALSGSNLRRRVVLILARDRRPASRVRVFIATAAPILVGALSVLVGGYRIVGAAPAAAHDAARAIVESLEATGVTRSPASAGRGAAAVATMTDPSAPSASMNRRADASPNNRRSTVRQPATAPGARPPRAGAVAVPPQDADESVPPLPSRPGVAAGSFAPASIGVSGPGSPTSNADNRSSAPRMMSPWTAAADAGVAVGSGAQDAAVATAGFFNRFGRKIADSF